MLRITSHLTGDECVLQLEGCIAGPWVPELARSWQSATAPERQGRVSVDLRDVCHVDDAGRALLAAMYHQGARFVAAGCVMRELVREIAQAADREVRS